MPASSSPTSETSAQARYQAQMQARALARTKRSHTAALARTRQVRAQRKAAQLLNPDIVVRPVDMKTIPNVGEWILRETPHGTPGLEDLIDGFEAITLVNPPETTLPAGFKAGVHSTVIRGLVNRHTGQQFAVVPQSKRDVDAVIVRANKRAVLAMPGFHCFNNKGTSRVKKVEKGETIDLYVTLGESVSPFCPTRKSTQRWSRECVALHGPCGRAERQQKQKDGAAVVIAYDVNGSGVLVVGLHPDNREQDASLAELYWACAACGKLDDATTMAHSTVTDASAVWPDGSRVRPPFASEHDEGEHIILCSAPLCTAGKHALDEALRARDNAVERRHVLAAQKADGGLVESAVEHEQYMIAAKNALGEINKANAWNVAEANVKGTKHDASFANKDLMPANTTVAGLNQAARNLGAELQRRKTGVRLYGGGHVEDVEDLFGKEVEVNGGNYAGQYPHATVVEVCGHKMCRVSYEDADGNVRRSPRIMWSSIALKEIPSVDESAAHPEANLQRGQSWETTDSDRFSIIYDNTVFDPYSPPAEPSPRSPLSVENLAEAQYGNCEFLVRQPSGESVSNMTEELVKAEQGFDAVEEATGQPIHTLPTSARVEEFSAEYAAVAYYEADTVRAIRRV